MALSTADRVNAVLEYWFGSGVATADNDYVPDDKRKLWFGGGPEVDQYITEHFGADVEAVADGTYDEWCSAAQPRATVAGIILMDQFTRNIYRGKPEAFSLDGKALSWAQQAVADGSAAQLPAVLRYFLLMPYMHSEDLAVQEAGVVLFREAAEAAEAGGHKAAAGVLRGALAYQEAHRDVVKAWGRFPHRNAILGRASTPQELAGLADGSIRKF
ncbi:hypothetical protein HYH02_009818 [Chlamydomonas schloesseri]|uniref:DUF924 domain-containing protein n=1 Tax=Chlamydomonas schloesseri TaxID=2026947 RepID=A0A835TNA1_9CHLO|nr:hypothetical protein HYH02_009818 [Chlamydomonas schloesseri]|eukprot:KAG2442026.1 hypothetical protein HYH02_009818 [Chlamydomonas schloesseri]